jgi:hypothetical protein
MKLCRVVIGPSRRSYPEGMSVAGLFTEAFGSFFCRNFG